MQVRDRSQTRRLRWLTIAVSILVLVACTSFATHVDKARGDDGKGHCSICLAATSHIVQSAGAVQVAPQIVAAAAVVCHGALSSADKKSTALKWMMVGVANALPALIGARPPARGGRGSLRAQSEGSTSRREENHGLDCHRTGLAASVAGDILSSNEEMLTDPIPK